MSEATIIRSAAETVYVRHPDCEYGIFCYNEHGDLFLNSDWGMFGYAWRHVGSQSFKDFLKGCDEFYIAGKFAINFNQHVAANRRFGGTRQKKVEHLIRLFLAELNNPKDATSKEAIQDNTQAVG